MDEQSFPNTPALSLALLAHFEVILQRLEQCAAEMVAAGRDHDTTKFVGNKRKTAAPGVVWSRRQSLGRRVDRGRRRRRMIGWRLRSNRARLIVGTGCSSVVASKRWSDGTGSEKQSGGQKTGHLAFSFRVEGQPSGFTSRRFAES